MDSIYQTFEIYKYFYKRLGSKNWKMKISEQIFINLWELPNSTSQIPNIAIRNGYLKARDIYFQVKKSLIQGLQGLGPRFLEIPLIAFRTSIRGQIKITRSQNSLYMQSQRQGIMIKKFDFFFGVRIRNGDLGFYVSIGVGR